MMKHVVLFVLWIILFLNIRDTHQFVKTRSQIPPSVWKELSILNSTADFIKKYASFDKNQLIDSNDTSISRNKTDELIETLFPGGINEAQPGSIDTLDSDLGSGFLTPPDEGCIPKAVAVRLPKDVSPEVVYWPQCVTLNQCGGCCGSDLLECAPSQTMDKDITAMKTRYTTGANNDPRFDVEGIIQIKMKEHVQCGCRCKVQSYHCKHPLHTYLNNACRCQCKNEADAALCPSSQKWDEYLCDCICRQVVSCHPDEYFNHDVCACNKINGDPNIDANELPENHPCSNKDCKAGYAPVPHGSECFCEPSNSWGEVLPGSIDISEVAPEDDWNPEVPSTTTTTTTTTVRPTRPNRPRPERRRGLGGRGKRRVRRNVDAYDLE